MEASRAGDPQPSTEEFWEFELLQLAWEGRDRRGDRIMYSESIGWPQEKTMAAFKHRTTAQALARALMAPLSLGLLILKEPQNRMGK